MVPARRFAAGGVRQRGGQRLPEWNGRRPVTARRVMDTDGGMVAGRAATINGRAAGDNPGWEGGSVFRRSLLTTDECARVLDCSTRTVQRIARAHKRDITEWHHDGKRRRHRMYDAHAVYELARARGSNLCAMCGTPARPHAYTCGANACVCAAWRARRAAYDAVRG
jgi:hypothetical protein